MSGGGKGAGYVTVYQLAFTDVADVTLWSDYTEGGKIRVRGPVCYKRYVSKLAKIGIIITTQVVSSRA